VNGAARHVMRPVVLTTPVEFDPFSDEFLNAPFKRTAALAPKHRLPATRSKDFGRCRATRDVDAATLKDYETYCRPGDHAGYYLANPIPTQADDDHHD